MAQNAPNCKDTQEIQFKLHDKFVAFRKFGEPRSNVSLLAVSSSRGLLFAGNPNAPELKVIIIKDIAAAKTSGKQPLARLVPLPNIPNYMACSADGNHLAINYTQPNGNGLLLIYSVQAFMGAELHAMYNIRLSPEDYVYAVQLLWNPVLPNSLAVVLSNGGLGMYALKEGGNFELHSLDNSQQVKCGCWSPKGKQIVLGFPSGRLQQFKPDLTPAKTLQCPPNVHDAPFDTIAVHWLSTFQFAVVFLQHGEDCSPTLYIINAPKAGTPTYTNYYDICYSLNGPRNHQIHFTHMPQWNLLLVSSANGVEVGVLGTTEPGDTPTWQQLTLLDEARIEMPLSEANQDETFPLGFALDTSSTHQLSINEVQLPIMPMIHVLSTDGILLAFNFLNLQAGAVSVCSPPPPLADTSGQFCALNALLGAEQQQQPQPPPQQQQQQPPPPVTASAAVAAVAAAVSAPLAPVEATTPALSDISFAFSANTVTSTPAPAKDKPRSMFTGFGNGPSNAPLSFGLPAAPLNFGGGAAGFGGFGAANTAPAATGSIFSMPASSNAPSFGSMGLDKPASVAPAQQPATTITTTTKASSAAVGAASVPSKSFGNNQPLYTVPPTFTPVVSAPAAAPVAAATKQPMGEVDDVIAEIMNVQISTFSDQIEQQKQQTQALLSQIEKPASIKFYAKRLEDLQELNEQANDVDFELDVQGLRHALSEAYAMMAECRAKLEVYKKPDITRLMTSTNFDAAGRRLLSRLQSYVAANEAQLHLAQQQIDSQWEQYQDVLRRNSKSKMHMPCLEGIYQRLTRLQNLTSDQRITQNNIKAKLKERGLLQSALLNQESSRARNNEAVDNLADSILSMTLNQMVDTNRAKLSQHKLQSIRQLLQQHSVHIISPQRPDRVGLNSEVIMKIRQKAALKQKRSAAEAAAAAAAAAATAASAATKAAISAKPAVAHKATQAAAAAAPAQLAKPTASKPAATAAVAPVEQTPSVPATAAAAAFTAPAPASAPFSFSQSSLFQKTTANTATTNTLSAGEAKPTTSLFGGTGAPFSFGAKAMPSIGGPSAVPKPQLGGTAAPNLFAGFGNASMDAAKPKAAAETPSVKPMESKKDANAAVDLTAAPAEPVKTAAASTKVESAAKSFSFASNAGSGGYNFSFASGGTASPFGKLPAASTAPASAATPAAPPAAAAATIAGSVETTVTSSSSSSMPAPAAMPSLNVAFGDAASIGSSSSVASTLSTASTAIALSSSSAPAVDSLFGSVNICKPQTKDSADAAPANIFGGFGQSTASAFPAFGGGGDGLGKGLFGATSSSFSSPTATTATPATTAAAPITKPAATATTTPATATPATAAATTTPATAAATTTPATGAATTPAATGAATTPAPIAATSAPAAPLTTAAVASPTSVAAAAPGSSFSFSNAFSSLSTASATPTGTLTATSSAPAMTGNVSGSIFGTSNAFAPAAAVSSPFGSAAAAPPAGNIFGNVPKPEASATPAAPPSGLFAAAAAASGSPSPFGSPAAAPAAAAASSGGSIFGQAAAIKPSGFGSPAAAGGSIFGGASPFGGAATTGGSIFGGGNSAQSPPAAAPTGSIFGQSVFGQSAASGGCFFGNASTPQTAFGSGGGGSIFGAAANSPSTAASGGSIFGGGASGGAFGQSTPAAGAFGSGFAQAGASVSQSGFGSPQQQAAQANAGAFGAKPVFGGTPAFGASPTFGGAPTFGSPKGFGSFGGSPGVVAPPAFGTPAKPPEGNIFETLGGTDTGLSFGNLAQTGSSNAQKSSYGGSSFMTYR